ncbi:MAG: hypothetical protein KF760_05840 [Candidatus Eremiobacteraeota bacterium]|nr:hypothetical protein [Candidatus Eremiobacteraeota bacterium]MCW5867084.1 hypothetical protein [Candidatus Eremiobacteraeota bacterium]
MLQEIRFCAVPNQGFPFALHVQQLVCIWPTYDGYAKNDLEEDLDEEAELAWSQIVSQALAGACQRMGWTLSTLEYRKTPSYWESEQRTWHLVDQELDADFVEDRENFGHELYLHIIGPQAIGENDFFPDDLPLLQWLHANHGFVFLGSEEAVLWAHFPHPELFLGQIKTLAQEYGHEMTHSKVPFRTFKRGKVDYVEGPDEE